MAGVSFPTSSSLDRIFSQVCLAPPSGWGCAYQLALSCTGKVLLNGKSLGHGILIGIDRFLVPAHVLEETCLHELTIGFVDDRRKQGVPYQVVNGLVDQELDCAILQLGQWNGQYPGERFPIPDISVSNQTDGFLVSNFEMRSCDYYENGAPCYNGYYCSIIDTDAGHSGSGYFNQHGHLFAMHLSRSSGVCTNPSQERKALLLSTIIQAYPRLFAMPKCAPLPELNVCLLQCVSSFSIPNICFVPEKHGTLQAEISDREKIGDLSQSAYSKIIEFLKTNFQAQRVKQNFYARFRGNFQTTLYTIYQPKNRFERNIRLDRQKPHAMDANLQIQVGELTVATVLVSGSLCSHQHDFKIAEVVNYVVRKFLEATWHAKKRNEALVFKISPLPGKQ